MSKPSCCSAAGEIAAARSFLLAARLHPPPTGGGSVGAFLSRRRWRSAALVTRASSVDSSSADFAKRMEQAWLISQQPRPIVCSSCDSNGYVECKWCGGTGFFIIGNNMLCEVPSRNTKCLICMGKGSACCSDCKGSGFRAKWLGEPPPHGNWSTSESSSRSLEYCHVISTSLNPREYLLEVVSTVATTISLSGHYVYTSLDEYFLLLIFSTGCSWIAMAGHEVLQISLHAGYEVLWIYYLLYIRFGLAKKFSLLGLDDLIVEGNR